MTREEAIAIIENEKKCVNRASKNDDCNRDCYNCELVKTDAEILEALDMAIKAMEQDSILDKIKAEIAMYEADCRLSVDEYLSCKQCTDNVFGSIYRIIEKYKAGE